MTPYNHPLLSLHRSNDLSRSKQHCKLISSLGTLLVITTLAVSVSGQTNITNSNGKTPSGMAPGSPAGSYPLSGFENINLFNGNLSFHLPLLTVGGRGTVSSVIMLGLNTKNWRVNHFHKVMPDESEIDLYSPTQNCTGASSGYGIDRNRSTNPFSLFKVTAKAVFAKPNAIIMANMPGMA